MQPHRDFVVACLIAFGLFLLAVSMVVLRARVPNRPAPPGPSVMSVAGCGAPASSIACNAGRAPSPL